MSNWGHLPPPKIVRISSSSNAGGVGEKVDCPNKRTLFRRVVLGASCSVLDKEWSPWVPGGEERTRFELVCCGRSVFDLMSSWLCNRIWICVPCVPFNLGHHCPPSPAYRAGQVCGETKFGKTPSKIPMTLPGAFCSSIPPPIANTNIRLAN